MTHIASSTPILWRGSATRVWHWQVRCWWRRLVHRKQQPTHVTFEQHVQVVRQAMVMAARYLPLDRQPILSHIRASRRQSRATLMARLATLNETLTSGAPVPAGLLQEQVALRQRIEALWVPEQ